MRDLKFRAWGPNSKYMWSWKELVANDVSVRWMQPSFGEKILMQYTGLKDKNGKEIYEGDVIKTPYYEAPLSYGPSIEVGDSIGQVVFNLEYMAYVIDWDFNEGAYDGLCDFDESDIEVIGNIYENPELSTETAASTRK